MKNLILNALKAKYEGVSEAILNRIADKLAKTVTQESDVATLVEGVTIQQVLESYGDSRATEATQSAVVNYEKKYGIKEGKVVTGGEPPKVNEPTNDETPAWAKAILESNKTLTEKVTRMEGEKITIDRKKQLETIVAKLPENLRKPYSRITVEGMTDEDFNSLTTEISTEVEGLTNDLAAKGVITTQPHGKGGFPAPKEPSAAELDAAIGPM